MFIYTGVFLLNYGEEKFTVIFFYFLCLHTRISRKNAAFLSLKGFIYKKSDTLCDVTSRSYICTYRYINFLLILREHLIFQDNK